MTLIQTCYLTFLGTLAAIAVLIGLNRLHPVTRLRNLTRRVLGVAAFEKKTIDELHIYRRDIDRWTRDTQAGTRRNSDAIISVREDVATRMAADRTRNNRVRIEVEELGILLRQYTDALGPMWTTAEGHKMPVSLLSTRHLKSILLGQFGDPGTRGCIQRELNRRSVDAAWRAKEAATTSDKRMNEGRAEAKQGWADPRLPMTYTPEVARRVRVLPKWVQALIGELVTSNPPKLTRSQRTRLQRMPIWAQQTIRDLEQPR